jgi:glycosyltransferase involved in cell wall biosynthesis
MNTEQQVSVAVLLATYNGARFVEAQLKSLTDNVTRFTLHWLDDHSTDDTREVVRGVARTLGLELREWHQNQRQGVPGTFFQLLECAEADIYLFCDQDDIWQAGKIDAVVENLRPDIGSPVLCFSEPLMFYDDEPEVFHRLFEVLDVNVQDAVQETRSLMFSPAAGQATAITRPLRDLYVAHRDIARAHAYMHSWWLFLIAAATGKLRALSNVPTTLYRQHGSNATTYFYARGRTFLQRAAVMWKLQHRLRRGMSWQAQGFIRAAGTLTAGPKLDRLLRLARIVAQLDRRQSLVTLMRLARQRAMLPSRSRSFWLAAACLCSDAKP